MPNRDGLVEPESFPAQREKKVYPPLQWWPLRVMNPWHKFGFLVVLEVAVRAAAQLTLLGIPQTAITVVSDILWPVAVIALARSFRGEGEPVQPPRPWWRLTARPMIGWFIGGFYALGELLAFVLPVRVDHYLVTAVSVVCGLFLGVAFLNSSIRLTILRRRPQ
ncbi:hypothetical protein ABCS02_26995 [Microbacterium sp. X-17]|uniref:hypothetical protein n=1 Tax=Microbacterium sp. X-17 TaxID=3144404 RepID=UPI0031F595A7